MKLKTLLTTLLTTTLLVTTAATGFGQLLLNENFDYGTTSGNLTTITTNWAGFSGTTQVGYIATSLSMADYQSSGIGGAATYNTANSEDITRTFAVQSSGSIYASFLLSATNSSTSGTYFFTFRNNAGAFFGRLQSKQGSAAGKLVFGIGAGSTITFGTNEYDENTTYLVVIKYDFVDGAANDVASLYILTAPTNTIPATPEATSTSSSDPTELSAVAIRQASGCGTGTIDGMRVANTWQEAAGIDMTAPVATFDPADVATGVSSAVNPTITFDEPVFAIGGAAITDPTSLITLTETDAMGTAVPFTAAIDGASKVITITPTSSLTPGQLYYLAIAPVQDAAGNATVDQSITFTTAATLSTATEITGFTLASVDGTIDAPNHTVSVVLPYGTDVTALVPTITLSAGATVDPASGVAQDFTNPVTYTVTAEDGVTTMPWMVTVTFAAPEFTATYPKSANVGKNQFDVVVNLKSAAKVYFLEQASGTAAPTSADVKASGTVIDVTTAATDFSSTITGLSASTAYDVYFVTEDNAGTILMDTPVKLTVTTSAGTLTIHDVQYTTDASGDSPYNNQVVTLNGTVTSLKYTAAGAYSGFYIQDAAGAWNGIYVYTSTYTVAQGDNVSVTGTVVEYKGTGTNLSGLTEISPATDVTVISSGNPLPDATLVTT
ncbi:MAG TPA: Ig-like domain-containing protein, partial [Williamwhitmania sp.]|nr:Ig-like domain-containing protein [Williamwhitmania sp.]